MARVTGLEPATSGVTGRHSNQLSYTRAFFVMPFGIRRPEGLFLLFRNGASDGARTRDLRRDRPAL
jgi:hypothetical protein